MSWTMQGRVADAVLGARGLLGRVAANATRMRTDLPLVALDALLVGVAYLGVQVLRFDGAVPADSWARLQAFVPIAVVVHLVANNVAGLYAKVWDHAGVHEARRVLVAGLMATSTLVLMVLVLPGRRLVPLSVAVLGGAFVLLLTGGLRFQYRLFAFQRRRHTAAEPTRVAVVGVGGAAQAVIHEMQSNRGGGLLPVAVVDDSPRHRGRTLADVPVLGGLDALREAAARYGAEQALLAVPSADSRYVRRVADAARDAGLTLKVLPSLAELLGAPVSVRDVRDLRIGDLLGRNQVVTDLGAVRRVIGGRRVLVTGGGGSIGSEVARQVAALDPDTLLLLDHDETHLHDAAAEIGHPCHQLLADIRDAPRVRQLFLHHRPDVVFHTAAHKHVPLLEWHPCEGVATNVAGTDNLLRAAGEVGVQHFVFISTDKAVNPSSVMGATKRLGEQLLLHRRPEGARYCAVRFGNVLGSRGSVIPTFMRQIRRGGPVTVTDPGVNRFFMSIPEAVQLVLQATALARGGEVFMLDMGEPVRIVDLAERLITLSGHRVGEDIRLEFTGLRPGEKLFEELSADGEGHAPTAHASITRVEPVVLDRDRLLTGVRDLTALARAQDADAAVEALFQLAGGQARGDGVRSEREERPREPRVGEPVEDQVIDLQDPEIGVRLA